MANIFIIGASLGIGSALAKQWRSEWKHVFGTFNKTTTPADVLHADGGMSSLKV